MPGSPLKAAIMIDVDKERNHAGYRHGWKHHNIAAKQGYQWLQPGN